MAWPGRGHEGSGRLGRRHRARRPLGVVVEIVVVLVGEVVIVVVAVVIRLVAEVKVTTEVIFQRAGDNGRRCGDDRSSRRGGTGAARGGRSWRQGGPYLKFVLEFVVEIVVDGSARNRIDGWAISVAATASPASAASRGFKLRRRRGEIIPFEIDRGVEFGVEIHPVDVSRRRFDAKGGLGSAASFATRHVTGFAGAVVRLASFSGGFRLGSAGSAANRFSFRRSLARFLARRGSRTFRFRRLDRSGDGTFAVKRSRPFDSRLAITAARPDRVATPASRRGAILGLDFRLEEIGHRLLEHVGLDRLDLVHGTSGSASASASSRVAFPLGFALSFSFTIPFTDRGGFLGNRRRRRSGWPARPADFFLNGLGGRRWDSRGGGLLLPAAVGTTRREIRVEGFGLTFAERAFARLGVVDRLGLDVTFAGRRGESEIGLVLPRDGFGTASDGYFDVRQRERCDFAERLGLG